jgi:hypothetical protein
VFLITFSKAGQEDIVLTEDDLFDFQYEASCYSGETFELGGVNAKTLYLLIDNNTQRFSRGTFANCRVKLEIDGKFFGYYNTELPKRRNGVIELTAYDDMVKLDTEFPTDYTFPQTFWAVYAQCVFEAGLASEVSFDNVVLNGVWDNGIISADYTQYIYANSCRNLVAGMAEWNGGFAYINDDNKLQIDKFSKTVTREYSSGDLMELDYSDETVVFSKVKTSQKNKTYEMGTDAGYTLVLKNQYISCGLDDTMFETYLTKISEYYTGFELTPMSFTLAEPDFDLHVGDRIQVYDEEEQVTITGNVSKIAISGNCSMTVTCGGFENVSSSSGFTPTSYSQIQQSKQEAKTSSQTTGGTLNEYKYLTDTSVKFNGTTYTIEKDATTGLISKISDSNGNSLEPGISAGITDAALHNAVFWAVAMARGISVVADSVLFTGQSGQWQFGGGLTGFTKRGPESQTYSGLDKSNYSSGIVAARLSKSYGSSNSLDGRTDAVVIQSNEKIDLTRFNKLRIRAVLFRNTSALTGAAYFCAGNPAAVQSGTAYDFSGWNKLGGCDIVSQNYSAPGTPTWYEVDVSRLSGEHYLNFGVSHGGNLVYTTYMDIHQIVLSTQ